MSKRFFEMNRLVIIGNGFDLAHGLPTSYENFIDDLWRQIALDENDFKGLVYVNRGYGFLVGKKIESYSHYLDSLENYKVLTMNNYQDANWDDNGFYVSEFGVYNKDYLLKYVNVFFKIICTNKNIRNWVDIENEYYILLKEYLKQDDNQFIIELNKQFADIKNLLEKHLIEKVEEDYVFSKDLVNEFLDIFNNDYYEELELNMFLKELSKNGRQVVENGFIELEREFISPGDVPRKGHMKDKLSLETFFLNFNYTSTIFEYVKVLDISINRLNQIHGKLEDVRNPINFGFGDEMDKLYQNIEEKNDNEYLRNIKSFQYLHTPNYKEFLDLIDSDIFQVYIMGHSCGLSDRTLLNTIFEHENCCSIKVFYYEEKDEIGKVLKDNYTEITQNISRHFNDKKLMRSKIVNKTLCEPLPQVKLQKYKSG
ncbi:MAG: hypothetical protein ACI87N_002310 [Flavobacteriales bacterium]